MDFEQFKTNIKKGEFTGNSFAWVCTYTPEEIIHAAGFFPVGIRKSSGCEDEDVYLGRNMCSFAHSIFGGALRGSYGGMKGIVIAHGCECLRRLYDGWNEWNSLMEPSYAYQLNVPVMCNNLAIKYFESNLRSFIRELEANYSVSITDEKLLKSIKLYNQTRLLLNRLAALRERANPPVTGQQVWEIIDICMSTPKEVFNEVFEEFLLVLEADDKGLFESKRKRILVYGGLYNPEIVKYIEREDTGGMVVCEDTCNGLRYFDIPENELSTSDPVEMISRRYLSKMPCSRISGHYEERIVSDLLALVKRYRVDGVVYYITKRCENQYWEFPSIKDALEMDGVPLKRIEGDISGDIPTRELKSFIELLNF